MRYKFPSSARAAKFEVNLPTPNVNNCLHILLYSQSVSQSFSPQPAEPAPVLGWFLVRPPF